jgi:hypothetical protein
MARPDSVPLIIERFKTRMVRGVFGRYRVLTQGRGKGGRVSINAPQNDYLTPANARKFADHLREAADFLDGGTQVITADSKCRCGSKKGLKMVQDRYGHNRSRLRWGPPHPLCPKCRKKDRGIFRYCPVKRGA